VELGLEPDDFRDENDFSDDGDVEGGVEGSGSVDVGVDNAISMATSPAW